MGAGASAGEGGGAGARLEDDVKLTEQEVKKMAGDKWNQELWNANKDADGTITGSKWNGYSLPKVMTKEEENSKTTQIMAAKVARRTSIADAGQTDDTKKMEKYMAT